MFIKRRVVLVSSNHLVGITILQGVNSLLFLCNYFVFVARQSIIVDFSFWKRHNRQLGSNIISFLILGNTVDSVGEMKIVMESLKSEVANLGTAVNSLRAEVIDMRDGMNHFKQGIADTVRQEMEKCLAENFPRFATMLTMEKNDPPPTDSKPVEEHKLINDEDDLNEFNRTLGNKQVFDDYVSFFFTTIDF